MRGAVWLPQLATLASAQALCQERSPGRTQRTVRWRDGAESPGGPKQLEFTGPSEEVGELHKKSHQEIWVPAVGLLTSSADLSAAESAGAGPGCEETNQSQGGARQRVKGSIADAHPGPRTVALSTSQPWKSHNSWGIELSPQGVAASGVGQN